MADKTPNHKLNLYRQGDENWTHTPDMETIEERLIVRDLKENRDDYTPYADALFFARDTGVWYVGNGTNWETTSVNADGLTQADMFVIEANGSYNVVNRLGHNHYSGSDASTALQAAIDNCTVSGTIHLRGYFDLDEEVQIDSNKRLVGHDAEIECLIHDAPAIVASKSLAGTTNIQDITFTEDMDSDSGGAILNLGSTAGMERGDIIVVESTEDVGSRNSTSGELHLIQAVDSDPHESLSSGEVMLYEPLEYQYDLSQIGEARHYKHDSVEFEGIKFTSDSDVENGRRAIEIQYMVEPTIESCTFDYLSNRGVELQSCYEATVRNSTFSAMRETGEYSPDGSSAGYGIAITGGSARTNVNNCRFRECRHAITHYSGGPELPRQTLVSGCQIAKGYSYSIDTHGDEWSIRVTGCTISQPKKYAIVNGCRQGTYDNNHFYLGNSANLLDDSRGIWMDGGISFHNNIVRGSNRFGGIYLSSHEYDHVSICGNEFHETSGNPPIRLRTSIDVVRIDNNFFYNSSQTVLDIMDGNGDGRYHSLSISGNRFENVSSPPIEIEYGDHFTISNNRFHLISSNPVIKADNLNDSAIINNHFMTTDGDAILLSASNRSTANNVIHGNVGHGVSGSLITMADSSNHTLSNNYNV